MINACVIRNEYNRANKQHNFYCVAITH